MGIEIRYWRNALECLKQLIVWWEVSQNRARWISGRLSIFSSEKVAMMTKLFLKKEKENHHNLHYLTIITQSFLREQFFSLNGMYSSRRNGAQSPRFQLNCHMGNFWQACHLSIFSSDPVVLWEIRGERRINVIVHRWIHSFFKKEILLVEVDWETWST